MGDGRSRPLPKSSVAPRGDRLGWRVWALGGFVVAGAATLITLVLLPSGVMNPAGRIEAGEAALIIGFGVLALDAVAPVPSSAVIIALGAFAGFGSAALVAIAGLLVAALVGYAMGAVGGRMARWADIEPPDWTTGTDRRAVLAVIASRPIPLIAETIAITAGAVRMRLALFVPSAAVGAVAPAIAYAALGSGLTNISTAWLVATSTIALVGVAAVAHHALAVHA